MEQLYFNLFGTQLTASSAYAIGMFSAGIVFLHTFIEWIESASELKSVFAILMFFRQFLALICVMLLIWYTFTYR